MQTFCTSNNREDAYSRTGGIFIRDTAYSLWFNEVWPYASLNHNEYAVSRAVSRMKMPPVREYASSLLSKDNIVVIEAAFSPDSQTFSGFSFRPTYILDIGIPLFFNHIAQCNMSYIFHTLFAKFVALGRLKKKKRMLLIVNSQIKSHKFDLEWWRRQTFPNGI